MFIRLAKQAQKLYRSISYYDLKVTCEMKFFFTSVKAPTGVKGMPFVSPIFSNLVRSDFPESRKFLYVNEIV